MTYPQTGLTLHDEAQALALPDIFAHARDVSDSPDIIDRSDQPLHPSMGDNGWAPDCTGESAREIITGTALLAGFQLAIKPGTGLAFYEQARGLPQAATQDEVVASNGIDMLTAARSFFNSGFDTGYNRYIALFGAAKTIDIPTLSNGSAKFGMLWAGVKLYTSDQDNLYSPKPWDDDGSDQGDIVGLHAIGAAWDYHGKDPTSLTHTVTYGMQKPTTWRWLLRRAVIVLALRIPQLDPAGARTVDEQALTAALTNWMTT